MQHRFGPPCAASAFQSVGLFRVQLTKGGVHDYATSANRSSSVEATDVSAKPAKRSSLPEMSEMGQSLQFRNARATSAFHLTATKIADAPTCRIKCAPATAETTCEPPSAPMR